MFLCVVCVLMWFVLVCVRVFVLLLIFVCYNCLCFPLYSLFVLVFVVAFVCV